MQVCVTVRLHMALSRPTAGGGGHEGPRDWKKFSGTVTDLSWILLSRSEHQGVFPNFSDVYNGTHMQPGPRGFANQLVLGGLIEAAVNWCTHNLRDRLHQLGIPATFDFQPTGTHSWGYWQQAMKDSWPVLADGLGLPR